MKQKLLALLFAFVASVGTMYAYTKIGYLYYNLDASTMTAEVTCQYSSGSENYSYLTILDIPTVVTYDSKSYNVNRIGEKAFQGCKNFTSVIIPESIKEIGESAFRGSKIESITLPSIITDIANYTFYGCTELKAIIIPTNVHKIGVSAFYGCSKLSSLTLSEGIETIGEYAFYNTPSLSSITIPMSIKSIGKCAFMGGSTSSKSVVWNAINCADFSTEGGPFSTTSSATYVTSFKFGNNVEHIPAYLCQNLMMTSISIPNSVKSIGKNAFYWCNHVSNLTIAKGVTDIGDRAFAACAMTSVTIPNTIKEIKEKTFYNCQNLTSVVIGDSVTTIADSAFYLCNSLKSATFGKNVRYIGKDAISRLTTVKVNNLETWCNVTFAEDTRLYLLGSNYNLYLNKSIVYDLVIPDGVTNINHHVFSGCGSIKSVSLPNTISKIGSYAFCQCTNLSSINLPNSIKSIGEAAFENTSLVRVDIPNSISNISNNLFEICTKLKYVSIPNSVTKIGESAFAITGLTSITIPNSVTCIADRAFSGCSGLKTINIPNSVTSIGKCAFCGDSITSVTIGRHVKFIDEYAFSFCQGLTSITSLASIPPSVGDSIFYHVDTTTTTLYVPQQSLNLYRVAEQWKDFMNILPLENDSLLCMIASGTCGDSLTWELYCDSVLIIDGIGAMYNYQNSSIPWASNDSSIQTIVIHDGCTGIGNDAFYGLTNLKTVAIPSSIDSIGERAFDECPVLQSIISNEHIFGRLPVSYSGEYIIPDGVVKIANSAFCQCSHMTSVTIPESMAHLGNMCFQYCSGLTSIICNATTPPTLSNNQIFNGVNKSIPLYVPAESVETYANTDGWNLFNVMAIPLCESYLFEDTISICSQDVFTWRNYQLMHSGKMDTILFDENKFIQYKLSGEDYIIRDSLITTMGCDSVYVLNIHFKDTYHSINNDTIVEGDSLLWRDKYLSRAGTYVDTLSNIYGCDSIIIINLSVKPKEYNFSKGVLPGCFSVSSTKRVHFSQGNLQFQPSTNEWRFAENQYDYIGNATGNTVSGEARETQEDRIDLYGWGTGNNPTLASEEYADYANFIDWGVNTIVNSDTAWRTPTYDEWFYLFYNRPNAYNLRGQATINNIHGYILLPDNWTESNGVSFQSNPNNWTANQYSVEQWALMENLGAVFLPCAGNRSTTLWSDQMGGLYYSVNNEGNRGNYWSATWYYNSMSAHSVEIREKEAGCVAYGRICGYSVRLINDILTHIVHLSVNNDTAGYIVGDSIYMNEPLTITAIPNDGYHFVQWSDGVIDNPRTLILTQDTTLVAEFARNCQQYFDNNDTTLCEGSILHEDVSLTWNGHTISHPIISDTIYNLNEWPSLYRPAETFTYLDSLKTIDGCDSVFQLNVTWIPSYSVIIYDTIYEGDNHYALHNNWAVVRSVSLQNTEIRYLNYATMLGCDSVEEWIITILPLPEYTISTAVNSSKYGFVEGAGTYKRDTIITITAIPNKGYQFNQWSDGNMDNPRQVIVTQDSAFTAVFGIKMCSWLVESNDLEMGAVITNFNDAYYQYGTQITVEASPNSGYKFVKWNDGKKFNPYKFSILDDKYLLAIFMEVTEEQDTTTVTPTSTTATFTWPFIVGGFSYSLTIYLDVACTIPFCTITFNQYGQLIGISFGNRAPRRSMEQEDGFTYTVSGLDANTEYYFKMETMDEDNKLINTDEGAFRTTNDATGIENQHNTVIEHRKVMINGQIYILRGDKTYTLQGQEVK